MRTDSCGLVRFSFTFMAMVSLMAAAGVAQVQQSFTPLATVPPNQMERSPLSQFTTTDSLIDRLNQPKNTGGLWVNPASAAPANNRQDMVTREVNLRKTLEKYAAFRDCSLDEAFAATVSYLKMVPLRDESARKMVGAQAIYSIVGPDIYRISASQTFFDALPINLLCLENGKRNLLIEVHFLGIPEDNPETFKSMMIPGSFVSFNNKIPQATPYATTASYRDESTRSNTPGTGTFVAATETRTKVYPTFMGRLDDQGVKKLLGSINNENKIKVTMAPSLVVSPGQTGSVRDALSRPFVVGMKRVEGDFALAHQPIVQPIEEGTFLLLRGTGENGKIRLDADLALSEIESVETFGYSDTKRDGPLAGDEKTNTPVTIQVPEQKLKQVHFSTLVEDGQTILIDPVFQRDIRTRIEKRHSALQGKVADSQPPAKSRIMLMIKPRWVDAQ